MPSKNSKNSKNDDRERSRPKSRNDLNKLTKRELKELCGEHGLATSGKRNDLFERLSIFFDFFEDNGDDDGIEKDTQEEKKDEEDDQKEEIEEEESDKETEKEPKVDVGKSDIPNGFNELLTLNKQRDSKEGLTTIIEGYDKLLETEPDNEYILVHKGVSLQYMQEYEQAVECYSSALKINPNNIEARMLLEGCRVMGVSKDITLPPQDKAIIEPADVELEEPVEEIVSHSEEIDVVEVEVKVETDTTLPEEVVEVKPEPVEKVHIAGTKTRENRQESLLGDTMSDFNTSTLTESKSRLTDVLQQLKSELHDGDNGGSSGKMESKTRASNDEDMKPLDLEKQSLREILDSEKSDDDFGSKILNSARKLLSMTDSLSDDGTVPGGSSPELGGPSHSGDELGKDLAGRSDFISLPKKSVPKLEVLAKPKTRKPTVPKRVRTGNISLDKLLQGGFLSASNILVNGPAFVDKDILLYKFASMGLRMDVPCIIINPETAPASIKDKFNAMLGDFAEYEEKGLIYWLDPESEEVISKFGKDGGDEFPEKQRVILKGIEKFGDQILESTDTYNVIFFSMSPMLMFEEPKVINRFLSRFSKRIKDDNAVALYTLDNTAHDSQDIGFVKRVMDGIVEIKQEAGHADHVAPTNYLKIDKLPYSGSYEWHQYKSTDKNFEIKAIPTYKKVM